MLRRPRAEGKGIVFIIQKLPAVLDVYDRVVVPRASRVTGTAPIGAVTRQQLAEMMVSRDVAIPRSTDLCAVAYPRENLPAESREKAAKSLISMVGAQGLEPWTR
jgi:ABC-type uncharacterized transport system ATPase subunit